MAQIDTPPCLCGHSIEEHAHPEGQMRSSCCMADKCACCCYDPLDGLDADGESFDPESREVSDV